ncbi:hypothetical protein GCM10008024_15270 [Allgaiera indica]|uniref:Uncharacterized protein n=2 Tax=Allgaiera indica TaxID=765699 RepID=A0AAN4ZYX8_9RHOB|nr:hypothetical protein GCM10008024_15270 [Allgaiera indica]
MFEMNRAIEVKRGSIYVPVEIYDTYFAGLEAVIVLIRDDKLMILPVRQMAAGGCLLKVRNARGDRVATAPDVFEAHGLAEFSIANLEVRWSAEDGALVADLPSPP